MASILVNLNVQHAVTLTKEEPQYSSQQISPQCLEMNLLVTPDGDKEGEALGYVNVQVQVNSPKKAFPDLSPNEMSQWLIDVLKRTL
ncbi:hypothetical protein [Komagataeibacter rhaeticus]|uniref:hypothetical protein n=1 Tax=Komagataeibacter rhaeticus TaxID=215221 RepID=UPI0005871E69|nr:hypothetical protein [Komagataeibacter rhaeticus]WPP22413.1 hypothetical protein SCD25_02645 [Komagataeibacter rhaeticus]